MLTLQQLYERAYQEHIEIDEIHMRELRAVSFPEGWIAIDRRRYRDDIEFKCDLAHEIGHVETGAFYNIYSPYDLKEKCEYKANKRAAEILMPLDEVREALHRGYATTWALAQYFEVAQEFAEMAMGMYEADLIADRKQEQLEAVLSVHGLKVANGNKVLPPMIKARELIHKKGPANAKRDDWKNDVYLKMDLL